MTSATTVREQQGQGEEEDTRKNSNDGSNDDSFQFQFFDEKTCEFMTPPPSSAKRGIKKLVPPSSATVLVNDLDWHQTAEGDDVDEDDEEHHVANENSAAISPIAPLRDDENNSVIHSESHVLSMSSPFVEKKNQSTDDDATENNEKEALTPNVHPALRNLISTVGETASAATTTATTTGNASESIKEDEDTSRDQFSPDLSLGVFDDMSNNEGGGADMENSTMPGKTRSINDEKNDQASTTPEKNESKQEEISNQSKEETIQLGSHQESGDEYFYQEPELLEPTQATSSEATQTPNAKQLQLDFSSARKLIDQSSNEFIERLRSAAHRRKVAMAKSRDSLAAKEREQQQLAMEDSKKRADEAARAASEAAEEAKRLLEEKTSAMNRQRAAEQEAMFKARPLPSTNGAKGMGGLAGVPKVETKPTTTPFSPLLGNRRKSKVTIKALEPPKVLNTKPKMNSADKTALAPSSSKGIGQTSSSRHSDNETTFKARPLPKSNGLKGHGGQIGVPKVLKRPVTVPFSPLLGHRRRKSIPSSETPAPSRSALATIGKSKSAGSMLNDRNTIGRNSLLNESTNLNCSNRSSVTKYSASSTGKSPLVGIHFLETTPSSVYTRPRHSATDEENLTPTNANTSEYIPHSTIRAQKRAAYDAVREEREIERHEKEKNKLEGQIREMHRHLRKLRNDLEF